MVTLFSAGHVGFLRSSILGSLNCAKYFDKYLKFGKTYRLKFGEMSYWFISYNIIISWIYTLNGFRIIFLLRDSATQDVHCLKCLLPIRIRKTLKCYYDQKLTSIFFHKSKVLMFNTYHAKRQVFISTRSVINWAIISGFGRPPLQTSNLAGNNCESWGGRGSDVIQSSQQKQLGYFSMRQVSSWKLFAVVFLRIRSKLNSNWSRPWQEYAS